MHDLEGRTQFRNVGAKGEFGSFAKCGRLFRSGKDLG
jgi:hypothetical protein